MNRPRLRVSTFSALSLLASLAPVSAAPEESDEGMVAFNNSCRTCHSFKAGDNRLGPSLHGVVGRKAGSLEGFAFSSAMKSSGITWDATILDQFVENPDKVVHGNGMKPYGGIADAGERKKIVDYLGTLK